MKILHYFKKKLIYLLRFYERQIYMKYNKFRKLGKNGEEVAPVGIGAMSFTNFYGPCNDDQANEVLTAALDLNLRHIDTSNIYGMGKSEERIGKFLSKQGKQANSLFNIATKAAIYSDPETLTYEAAIKSKITSDFYLTMSNVSRSEYYNIKFQNKPFMIWIWISVIMIVFGGFLRVFQNAKHN